MNHVMAVIMAGGKGTRISSVRADIPKPMIEVEGKNILEYQMECLKENGITEVVLVIGHLGHIIQEYFGDGANIGMPIRYIVEETPLGTAGALYYLNQTTKDVLLLNGDIIFDVDLKRMLRFHREKNADITLFTHPNNHPYDSTLVLREEDGQVIGCKKNSGDILHNCVNAGIHILSARVVQKIDELKPRNLDKEIIAEYAANGRVYSYASTEYVHDMGTPDRYKEVCEAVKNGMVHAKNLSKKQKAIFLDRDGTINIYKGFLTKPEEMELEPRAAEAIKKINASGYLAIVVTNQPVIARGDCTKEQLEEIHGRMEYLLGKEGAYVDAIFYCPHHPDKGFAGEVAEYKIDCDCRKPKPGLLLQAEKIYNIDLAASYMIGDSQRDVEAGKRAGCKAYLLGEVGCEPREADGVYLNLLEAVEQIIKQEAEQ